MTKPITVTIELSADHIAKLAHAVSSGHYTSLDEAISKAIEEHLTMKDHSMLQAAQTILAQGRNTSASQEKQTQADQDFFEDWEAELLALKGEIPRK